MRLGFFTRVLDAVSAGERYRLATEQIRHAEAFGFESAWIAQHHFDANEGGLPAPLVFLGQVAARTSRIRLGTGIITLPLEDPVRVAEDTAVLDLLASGRLEVGIGSGGTPSSFTAFGRQSGERGALMERHLSVLLDAWAGRPIGGSDRVLYPTAPSLIGRVWQATFSVGGGIRAGKAGDGLMLSRTQPRPADSPRATLAEIQKPIIEAYLAALPRGAEPRIAASRSVFVADSQREARHLAEIGLRRNAQRLSEFGRVETDGTLDDMIRAFDVHVGTPDDAIASLRADRTLEHATDLVCQVHSVDPPHPLILRSIELIATDVAPALGWKSPHAPAARDFATAG